MFCTNCGSALGVANSFCTSCGALVTANHEIAEATKIKTPKPKPASRTEEDITPAGDDTPVLEKSPEAPSDPYKPAGMSHADYAYQGISSAPARKSSKSLRLILVAVLALLILAITAGGMSLSTNNLSGANDSQSAQESSDETLVDPATEEQPSEGETTPDDYYEYDGIFSYRWSDVDRTDTCDGCSYWMLDVKTTVDCSVIFVEMEVTNDAGAIVQTISNEAYGLKAGVAKLMTLDTWRDDAAGGDVSQMTCQE
jgi:DNA-directed RNA polymerase subunit M/transcription elongation factor TFIIS